MRSNKSLAEIEGRPLGNGCRYGGLPPIKPQRLVSTGQHQINALYFPLKDFLILKYRMIRSKTIYDYLETIELEQVKSDSLLDKSLNPQSFIRGMTHDANNFLNGFTITLRPQMQRTDAKKVRLQLSNDIRTMFFKTKREIGIELHCEFTQMAVLHFHGIIYCSKKYQIHRFLTKMRKNYGFVKTEHIRYLDKWLQYCFKRDELKPVFFYKKK